MSYLDDVVNSITGSHEERAVRLSTIANETSNLLKGFKKEQQKMAQDIKETAQELRTNLDTFYSELKKGEKERTRTAHSEIKGRRTNLEKMLNESQSNLTQAGKDRRKSFKETEAGIQSEIRDIQEKVQEIIGKAQEFLKDVKEEHQKAAFSWKSLAKKVKGVRAGKPKEEKEHRPQSRFEKGYLEELDVKKTMLKTKKKKARKKG